MSEESNVTEDAIKAHVKKIISEEVTRFSDVLMKTCFRKPRGIRENNVLIGMSFLLDKKQRIHRRRSILEDKETNRLWSHLQRRKMKATQQ